MDSDLKLIVICGTCKQRFDCQSNSVGGEFICNKCYPIWFAGILIERNIWEKWTGKTFSQMYTENEKEK